MALFPTLLGGCSFLFSDGPPPGHRQMPYFDCSSSKALPVTDSVLAGVFALSAIGAASSSGNADGSPYVAGAMALALALSARQGFANRSECDQAKNELAVRLGERAVPTAAEAPPAPAGDPWLTPPPGSAPRAPDAGAPAKP